VNKGEILKEKDQEIWNSVAAKFGRNPPLVSLIVMIEWLLDLFPAASPHECALYGHARVPQKTIQVL